MATSRVFVGRCPVTVEHLQHLYTTAGALRSYRQDCTGASRIGHGKPYTVLAPTSAMARAWAAKAARRSGCRSENATPIKSMRSGGVAVRSARFSAAACSRAAGSAAGGGLCGVLKLAGSGDQHTS